MLNLLDDLRLLKEKERAIKATLRRKLDNFDTEQNLDIAASGPAADRAPTAEELARKKEEEVEKEAERLVSMDLRRKSVVFKPPGGGSAKPPPAAPRRLDTPAALAELTTAELEAKLAKVSKELQVRGGAV